MHFAFVASSWVSVDLEIRLAETLILVREHLAGFCLGKIENGGHG
jgi:hypothetical protein